MYLSLGASVFALLCMLAYGFLACAQTPGWGMDYWEYDYDYFEYSNGRRVRYRSRKPRRVPPPLPPFPTTIIRGCVLLLASAQENVASDREWQAQMRTTVRSRSERGVSAE